MNAVTLLLIFSDLFLNKYKRKYLRKLCNTRIAPSQSKFHEAFLHTMYVKMQAIKTSNLCFAQIAKIETDRKNELFVVLQTRFYQFQFFRQVIIYFPLDIYTTQSFRLKKYFEEVLKKSKNLFPSILNNNTSFQFQLIL